MKKIILLFDLIGLVLSKLSTGIEFIAIVIGMTMIIFVIPWVPTFATWQTIQSYRLSENTTIGICTLVYCLGFIGVLKLLSHITETTPPDVGWRAKFQ